MSAPYLLGEEGLPTTASCPWRRVQIQRDGGGTIEAFELKDESGVCAECGEDFASHSDDELRGCATALNDHSDEGGVP